MHRFACVVCSVVLMGLAADRAAAQTMESKFDIFGGYSYLSSESFDPTGDFLFTPGVGRSGNHGFDVRFTFNLTSVLGIEADFASHRRDSTPFNIVTVDPTGVGTFVTTDTSSASLNQKSYSLLFGPKLSHRAGPVQIYAHVLVGLANVEETATVTDSTLIPAAAFAPNSPTLQTTQTSTDTATVDGSSFGFAAGGGVDWIVGSWGIRIIEIDYVKVPGSGDVTGSSQNTCTPTNSNFCGSGSNPSPTTITGNASGALDNIRISVGFIWRMGKR